MKEFTVQEKSGFDMEIDNCRQPKLHWLKLYGKIFILSVVNLILLATVFFVLFHFFTETGRTVELAEYSIYQLPNQERTQSMGYIIQTQSGKVLVVDGGAEDATPELAETIRALGGTVDAWLVTHPHFDHVTAMMDICTQDKDIQIKKIYASLVDYNQAFFYEPDYADNVKHFDDFIQNHQDIFQSVQMGDMFLFDGLQVNVLLASNPEITANYINNQSVVYKISTKDSSALFLGDLGEAGGEKLLHLNGNKIDSDIVQAAHHGQKGVAQDVYQTISPQICLWPTPAWLWNNQPPNAAYNSGPWTIMETRKWMDCLNARNVVGKDGYAKIEVKEKEIVVFEADKLAPLLSK